VIIIIAVLATTASASITGYGSSNTTNGITTTINVSSSTGDTSYEHVYLTVSSSNATDVSANVWYYKDNDVLFASNSDTYDSNWYKFDFKVRWSLLDTNYYVVGKGSATIGGTRKSGTYVDALLA
jgi:hypothetical protein